MATNNGLPATPREALRLMLRHKLIVMAGFLLTVAVAVAVVVFWPRSYISEAKLLVGVGRESVTLDPTVTTGEVIPVEVPREVEINSIVEMLESRGMVEKVVDTIGPEVILGRAARRSATPSQTATQHAAWRPSLPQLDPISDRERAVTELSARLNVSVAKKSNIISVSCAAKTPQLARQIVAALVDIYLDVHARLNHTAGASAFFYEQTALLQRKLTESLATLRDTKNEMGIVSVDSQREILRNELVAVETDLAKTLAAHAAAEAQVEILTRTVASVPDRITVDQVTGYPNAAADQMRKRLYDLEILEADLASRFTPTHPPLVAARREIESARTILDQQKSQRTQSTSTINRVHMELQLKLFNEQGNVRSLAARAQTLKQQLARLRSRVQLMNQHEVQLATLERQAALCAANYKTYADKLEQSRINDALQNERITNVNVVQPALLIAKPVRPQKLLVLVMGLLGAVLAGTGSAFAAESFAPSLASSVARRRRGPAWPCLEQTAPAHASVE